MLAMPASQLQHKDFLWLAERIHAQRKALADHPRWARRIEIEIDNLLWSASVDGVSGEVIVQDAWVRSGQSLRAEHFANVPYTKNAMDAFRAGALKTIKREHMVPRSRLRVIVGQIANSADTARVLEAFARVTLVHEDECKRLVPSDDMPRNWDASVDWTHPPETLPDPWARYRTARPAVVPLYQGRPLFT
jgi:hypothetical protein